MEKTRSGQEQQPMNKIESFCVNHLILTKGMYISRIDGDIVTYDIRAKAPNQGDYLTNAAIHSFEHLFATYVRNSEYKDNIIYVGPMGCLTGFYFITRGLPHQQALELFQATLEFISSFNGAIPGVSEIECGNYLEHSLEGAIAVAQDLAKVLEGWTVEQMVYQS